MGNEKPSKEPRRSEAEHDFNGDNVMKTLELRPDGFPCTLAECPPGLFLHGENVGLKTEYGATEAFCDSGERFWGGVSRVDNLAKVIVQPLIYEWNET
jgi:hypothetical protein